MGVATERIVTRLDGHRAAVLSAEFGPAGDTVLTASVDDTARISGLGNGGGRFRAAAAGGRHVRHGASSRRTAGGSRRSGAASRAGSSSASGRALRELPSSGNALEAEFSPDGRYLGIANIGSTPRVYDVRSGRIVLRGRGSASPPPTRATARWRSSRAPRSRACGTSGRSGGRGSAFGGTGRRSGLQPRRGTAVHRRADRQRGSTSGSCPPASGGRFRAAGLRRPTAFSSGEGGIDDIQLSRDGTRLLGSPQRRVGADHRHRQRPDDAPSHRLGAARRADVRNAAAIFGPATRPS